MTRANLTITTYDPWDRAVMNDPYPFYEWLREEHRVYRNPEHGFYVLSRFEDVGTGLRDHKRLVSGDGTALHPGPFGPNADPPDHTYERRILSHPFAPRTMRTFSAAIEQRVSALLDSAVEEREVDVVTDIANPLAMFSLAHTVGLPDGEHESWLDITSETFRGISAREPSEVAGPTEVQVAVWTRVDEVVEARKRSNELTDGADLVSAVIAAAEPDPDGRRLDRIARSSMVVSLVPPGLETTRHLIGSLFELIARYPHEWHKVRDGDVTPSQFVEEALRFESPVQGFFRGVREGLEVGGESLPAGSRVLLLYGAANRDERVFESASEFRPGRPSGEHLAFGAGIHYCVGAGLARLEVVTLVTTLAKLVKTVRLLGDGTRTPHALNRGWEHLPVELEPA